MEKVGVANCIFYLIQYIFRKKNGEAAHLGFEEAMRGSSQFLIQQWRSCTGTVWGVYNRFDSDSKVGKLYVEQFVLFSPDYISADAVQLLYLLTFDPCLVQCVGRQDYGWFLNLVTAKG